MKASRHTRQGPRDLTAKTGEPYADLSEDEVASDTPLDAVSGTALSSVGRTPVDLLYDSTLRHGLARFLASLDPLEFLVTAAFILLGVWGKYPDKAISFRDFLIALIGYHVVARPLARWLMVKVQSGPPTLPGPGVGSTRSTP